MGGGRGLYNHPDGKTMLTDIEVPLSSAAGLKASLCERVVRVTWRYHPLPSVDLIE